MTARDNRLFVEAVLYRYRDGDREDDAGDSGEIDVDGEPTLGALDRAMNQTRGWTATWRMSSFDEEPSLGWPNEVRTKRRR